METPRAKEGERRVAIDSWDVDGWNLLAMEAQRAPFPVAKPVYERLVTQFPPTGKFWRFYAEQLAQQQTKDLEPVFELYDRAVADAPTSVDLWQSYVSLMVAHFVQSSSPSLETRTIAVFERALAAAGLDIKSDTLWSQYLVFIADHASLSDAQRREDLRRLHQRAVRNPMDQLDVFWRNYTEFENNIASSTGNKDAARAILSEVQGKHHEARTEYRARAVRRQGTTIHALPVPPRSRSKEMSQAQGWRRFIAWEKSNPGGVSAADLHSRIIYAYETALVPLYRYAEFWMEYVGYLHEHLNLLLERETADGVHGSANSKNSAKDATGRNVATPDAANNNSVTKAETEALESVLKRAVRALPDCVAMHVYVNYIYMRLGKGDRGVAVLETLVQKHPSPLAYIHLMRATWKHDGRDAARKTFARGRKDKSAAHPLIYVAAAMMEFAVNKDSKVPRNVFEFGLKNFPKNAGLAFEFVNWLWGTGDTEYARVVLRKVLPDAQGTEDEVRRLWERWLELEEVVGDAASVDRVLSMWKESGVGRSPGIVHDVLRMTRFHGVEGLAEDELAVIGLGKDINIDTSGNGTGNSSGSAISSSGNTGGKRDPRTGRRVDKSGNLSGKGKEGIANGMTVRRRGLDASEDNVMKVATSWLELLASTMPPITDPIPNDDINAILRMVVDTPESFTDTPAGRTKATLPTVATGKKRKSDELHVNMPPSVVSSAAVQAGALQQDVFRARQAAKQSRLR